jgi:hypothetical protein
MANDVYYSVDNAQSGSRLLKAYSAGLGYEQARSHCIRNGGDLVIVDSATAINDVIATITEANGAGTSIKSAWVGLRYTKLTGKYEWTDENARPYNDHAADFDSFWSSKEASPSGCVSVNVSSKLWQAVPCTTALSFVCRQLPPVPDLDETTYTIVSADAINDISTDNKKLALYIVLPIFLFCYGGSCVLYCAYKIYKNCCRARKDSMLLEKTVAYPPRFQFPDRSGAPRAAPVFSQPLGVKPKYIGVPEKGNPLDNFMGRKKGAVYPIAEEGIAGAMIGGEKMSEAYKVNEIGMTPLDKNGDSMQKPPSYEDMKNESRARLLENAAQLARERKKEKEVEKGVDQVERKVAPILGAMPGIDNGEPKSQHFPLSGENQGGPKGTSGSNSPDGVAAEKNEGGKKGKEGKKAEEDPNYENSISSILMKKVRENRKKYENAIKSKSQISFLSK